MHACKPFSQPPDDFDHHSLHAIISRRPHDVLSSFAAAVCKESFMIAHTHHSDDKQLLSGRHLRHTSHQPPASPSQLHWHAGSCPCLQTRTSTCTQSAVWVRHRCAHMNESVPESTYSCQHFASDSHAGDLGTPAGDGRSQSTTFQPRLSRNCFDSTSRVVHDCEAGLAGRASACNGWFYQCWCAVCAMSHCKLARISGV